MNAKAWAGLGGIILLFAICGAVGWVIKWGYGLPGALPVHNRLPAIQPTKHALLIRTDFTDDAAWNQLIQAVARPVRIGPVTTRANLELLDDSEFADASIEAILPLLKGYAQGHDFFLIADTKTLFEQEGLLLVVDLGEQPGRSFRAPIVDIALIENNLTLGNMAFGEFADRASSDGVFRGFD